MAEEELRNDEMQLARLKKAGVRFVRLQYPDLHGVPRGKVLPVSEFERRAEEGVAFAGAVMTVDLRHNTVAGFQEGIPDMRARPDLATLVQLPWDPEAAWCLCDLENTRDGHAFAVDPRHALRRAVAAAEELGFTPIFGPELEFYLCERNSQATNGLCRYLNHDSSVYTVGGHADPRGILERMLAHAATMGLGAYAANHEYGRSQFEINLSHSHAADSADRAFRYKALVKELAVREGLLATFMGKPWNDDEGSGLHLHVSLETRDGRNAFDDPNRPHGLSRVAEHFVAGVLEQVPAIMAFLNPTVNAYRRINLRSLAPTRINWGFDHRFALIRIPPERGRARRIEIRVCDGTANPYLAYAAVLHAGIDGVRRKLEAPEPVVGLIDELPEERRGTPLPTSLADALSALEANPVVVAAIGRELVDAFLAVKRAELARYMQWTSDWELREYSHWL